MASKDQFWAQPPRDPKRYADFMYTVAARYKGKIKVWELWNEPDNREYWQGSVEAYAELVKGAAVAVRRANPSAVLVLGGMSRGPSPFVETLLSQYGIADYVDVIAMHAYAESWDEERAETIYQDWVQKMADLIESRGEGADFWINEMGYADYRFRPNQASKWGTNVNYDYEHTSDYQAKLLFKAEVMSLTSPRVSLTAWYRIDDFSPQTVHFSDDEVNYHLGLTDTKGEPKPAFYALRFFQALFDRPVVLDRGRVKVPVGSQSVLKCFRTAERRLIVVGWLRSSKNSEVTEHTGEAHDRREESVAVELPCKGVADVRSYDAEGHSAAAPAIRNGWLQGIKLRGDAVFVGTVICR